MRCIYCLECSDTARNIPHAFPESIARNEYVLPVGAECDPCNAYLGHELDNELVAHPIISLMLQFLELPGKKGKPRKMLGNVTLNLEERWIAVPTEEPRVVTHADGSRSATARPLIDGRFNLWRFRRALHRVAFNAIALQHGVDHVLAPRFDAARRYIRFPARSESWPYVQAANLLGPFPRETVISLFSTPNTEIVAFSIVAAAFAVDLLNSGQLFDWAKERFDPDTQFIDASYRPPRPRRQDPKRMYLLRIMLDEAGRSSDCP